MKRLQRILAFTAFFVGSVSSVELDISFEPDLCYCADSLDKQTFRKTVISINSKFRGSIWRYVDTKVSTSDFEKLRELKGSGEKTINMIKSDSLAFRYQDTVRLDHA